MAASGAAGHACHGLWDRPDWGLPAGIGLLQLSSNTAGSYWMVICLLIMILFGGLLRFFLSFMSLVPSLNSSYCCLLCFWELVLLLFLLFVCLLRIMLTFVSPFCLLFFFFSRLLQQACHTAAPNWSWQGEKEARGSGDSQTGWNTEDWRECNTRGSETILNHIQNVNLAYITTLL